VTVFAPFNGAAPVRTGAGEIVLTILVSESNNASALPLRRTEVVRGLTVLVKVTYHLTVATGMTVAMAGKAGSFGILGRGRTSSKTVWLHLVVLALPLAELWVLPYKGPEAAGSVSSDEASPHLFLALGVLPPLMLVMKPLLSCEEFKAFDVSVLAVELICPSPTIPESDYICVYPVIPQPLQGLVKSTVHHMGFGQEGQVFFIVSRRGASSFNW
jgi:hypothetical protein